MVSAFNGPLSPSTKKTQMSEERKRSFAGAMPPPATTANHAPSTNGQKTNASAQSISSTSNSRKVIIKSADMKEELQTEAVNIAISAFENLSVEKDVAEQIKKEFDKNHGPTWHCIVGKNFEIGGGRTAPAGPLAQCA